MAHMAMLIHPFNKNSSKNPMAAFIKISIFLLILVIFVILTSGAQQKCGLSTFNGDRGMGKMLIDGQVMRDATQLPWMALLYYGGLYSCTASIIGPRHILISASCVQNRPTKFMKIMVGTVDYVFDQKPLLKVKRIFQYNQFYTEHDVAVIELENELQFSSSVQQICLSANDTSAFENKMPIAAGWGMHSENASSNEKIDELFKLRFGRMQIPSNQSICEDKTYKDYPFKADRELCAASGGQSNVCHGDQGGPLIVKLAGQRHWTQVGIAGWFKLWDVCGPFHIYARISFYCEWIEKVTEGAVKCEC